MLSKPIQTLVNFFLKFPGVGPRQAARFAFHLLREDRQSVQALARAIAALQDDVRVCRQCYKTFDANHGPGSQELCEFCRDRKRDSRQVLVVEKEADLENIERTHKYHGLYHVLGGTIDPLDSAAPARLHMKELFGRAQSVLAEHGSFELVLATNPTSEGDATALYLERILAPLARERGFAITRLGRGLSRGAELEYADDITVADALENRK